MKILFIDTYYEKFLKNFYKNNIYQKNKSYKDQHMSLLDSCFGTSDSYSFFLKKNKIEAKDLIVNCFPLQNKWAKENDISYSNLKLKIPYKLLKLPLFRKLFSNLQVLYSIVREQIRSYKPDILYCQDLSFFTEEILNQIKEENNIKLLVGQIACPLPPDSFLKPYDLILTSFPHFVSKLNFQGKNCEYFKIGFDKRILDKLPTQEKDINFSFVGGISKHHNLAFDTLEYLSSESDIQIYGYGSNNLPLSSHIRKKHNGEKWGLEMFKVLAKTKISFNRHINIAENNANNMRLYEATGMGSLLLTDQKDNLKDLFKIDKEIVTYSCKEEALEKYNYLVNNPIKTSEIAAAGQARTLKDHTYENRMKELLLILKKYF